MNNRPDFERAKVDAVISCAMDIEAYPFWVAAGLLPQQAPVTITGAGTEAGTDAEEDAAEFDFTPPSPDFTVGRTAFFNLELWGFKVLLLRTGIGLVNASAGAAAALSLVEPRAFISAGSAGGLGQTVNVGDVIISQTLRYHNADATIFGYEPGQIPGMPIHYEGDERLVAAAVSAELNAQLQAGQAEPKSGQAVLKVGEVVSGDSFITSANVTQVREMFPQALGVDMESVALAQVCDSYQVPFVSIRGVSDLCGPQGDQEHHLNVEIVAASSALITQEVLKTADLFK